MQDDAMRLKALNIMEASEQVQCGCGWPSSESCAKHGDGTEPPTGCAAERTETTVEVLRAGVA